MNKTIRYFFICLFFILPHAFAQQQITRFGVVDTSRVYQSYFRNSTAVRNYESKKAQFQEEINKRTLELQNLQAQKLEYEKNDNQSAALRIESEIVKKTDFLNEYTNAKNIELETIKNSLQRSDSFYQKLYATLSHIAESEGYSMILSLQQANAILWYSPSVDITDQVIRELGL
ncbi:OmpH family outer membrane protein [Treponema parvum]|uniref:OmpH family outer membrane protein n=1 Tax=Treponema parvum TaxID=138851 RepID=A0A975F3J7_9SPIR|nr:OmpH family outer membrane protein [Treponema parvum]QTQ12095.1 OmpH family outer membrane protein [Treponema parvum]QTQ13703.1 OmpH family outer membrane protein [Treponema parvum]QTQ15929.1 OmpH family outer membrane protein [Treponema parvum]